MQTETQATHTPGPWAVAFKEHPKASAVVAAYEAARLAIGQVAR